MIVGRKGAVSWAAIAGQKRFSLEEVAIMPILKNNRQRRKKENFSWRELSFIPLSSLTSSFPNQGYFRKSK